MVSQYIAYRSYHQPLFEHTTKVCSFSLELGSCVRAFCWPELAASGWASASPSDRPAPICCLHSNRTQDVVLSKRGFWFDFLTAPALLPREGGKRKPRGKTRDEQERAAREYPAVPSYSNPHSN
jgi:hypothetical protein